MTTKFEYPWEQAPDWANWAATDEDGRRWWYEYEPHTGDSCLYALSGKEELIDMPSYDFSQSKQSRPNSGN